MSSSRSVPDTLASECDPRRGAFLTERLKGKSPLMCSGGLQIYSARSDIPVIHTKSSTDLIIFSLCSIIHLAARVLSPSLCGPTATGELPNTTAPTQNGKVAICV